MEPRDFDGSQTSVTWRHPVFEALQIASQRTQREGRVGGDTATALSPSSSATDVRDENDALSHHGP